MLTGRDSGADGYSTLINTGIHGRVGGLSDQPNPETIAGLQTSEHRMDTGHEQQFSLETTIDLLLHDDPQSKKSAAVGPVSPP